MKKLLLSLSIISLFLVPFPGRSQDTEPAAGNTAAAPVCAVPGVLPETATPVTGPVIKVLTFNTWEIISAKERETRAAAMGKRVAELDPDIISIQEMFEERHRKIFLQSLADHGWKPAGSAYFNRLYGSGILFLSKYPILSITFEAYRVNAPWYDIERIGGKGLAHLLLDTPYGRLDYFITHAISRTPAIFDDDGNFIPGDPRQVDRILQMYQIDRFVRALRAPRGRSLIMSGDFNVSPEMLEYPFLVRLTGFESSFELLNPGQNPSTFCKKTDMWVTDEFSRIDHIFFKNFEGQDGFWLRPVLSRVEMTEKFKAPDGREYNYSDHYGLYSEFEVVTDPAAVKPSPAGLTRNLNACAACAAAASAGDAIALTAENAPAWDDYALWVLGDAYRRKDRTSPLVIPMAEIIAADAAGGATVKLSDPARAELKKTRCPQDCAGEGQAPGKPGNESLTRKMQSFSPWR